LCNNGYSCYYFILLVVIHEGWFKIISLCFKIYCIKTSCLFYSFNVSYFKCCLYCFLDSLLVKCLFFRCYKR
jgi:hypothetical protein